MKPGTLTGIIGVNGSGKSTLLRTLGKLQPSLSGSIDIHGVPIAKHTPKALATAISLVLTETVPAKNLTVAELISLGRQPYTNWIGALSLTDKEIISRAMAMVELNELQQKKCFELSDGQLQKVMIARALAQDTDIMLLDEPTTHLDMYHKVQVLKLLQTIAQSTQKTILFTTHEIGLALQLCDAMLIIDHKTNPFGTPATLIKQQHITNLFPQDILYFDANTGAFKIP